MSWKREGSWTILRRAYAATCWETSAMTKCSVLRISTVKPKFACRFRARTYRDARTPPHRPPNHVLGVPFPLACHFSIISTVLLSDFFVLLAKSVTVFLLVLCVLVFLVFSYDVLEETWLLGCLSVYHVCSFVSFSVLLSFQ